MKAVVHMGIGEAVKIPAATKKAVFGVVIKAHPQIDIGGKVFQLGIQFQKSIHGNVLSRPWAAV